MKKKRIDVIQQCIILLAQFVHHFFSIWQLNLNKNKKMLSVFQDIIFTNLFSLQSPDLFLKCDWFT